MKEEALSKKGKDLFPPLENFVFYKDIPLLSTREIAASKEYTL